MTPEQRAAVVKERRQRRFPLHRPPHLESANQFRLVTAACFEHKPLLNDLERLTWFETALLEALTQLEAPCTAWCVLPNHYHLLVQIVDIKAFARGIGQLHGRTAFELNRRDNARGRKGWYSYEDRCIRSDRHYYTSLNYVHHNPVKHGYVEKWQDWPFSSVHDYLETKGRDWLVDVWREYPLLDYGKKWDE
jgi:putative transposase